MHANILTTNNDDDDDYDDDDDVIPPLPRRHARDSGTPIASDSGRPHDYPTPSQGTCQ